MRFVAIDVETANPNMASICQIGLVRFEDGHEVASDVKLVDPRDYFDPINVSIHGICQDDVCGAPAFADAHSWLHDWTADQVVVCHTAFDRTAIGQACRAVGAEAPTCSWLDSARVTRRAWPQFAQSGYGLANVAKHCGIQFEHHDALHDARAAGLVLMHAIRETGIDLAEWLVRSLRPSGLAPSSRPVGRIGDGDGALVGEAIVFTGALAIPRHMAADRAAKAGADVLAGVSKKATMLVVGDQDIAKLNGRDRSSKHLKALSMIDAGHRIRIIGETDFLALSAIIE